MVLIIRLQLWSTSIRRGCRDCWMLLSDVRMPQMSGFELVKKIKQLRPDFVVLLMSAFEINKDESDKVLPPTKVGGLFRSQPSYRFWLKQSSDTNRLDKRPRQADPRQILYPNSELADLTEQAIPSI
jgi:CheY-like chemotaxis protein